VGKKGIHDNEHDNEVESQENFRAKLLQKMLIHQQILTLMA
jgi:hypothetical protein